MNIQSYYEEFRADFMARVNRDGLRSIYVSTPCWDWIGWISSTNYGMFVFAGRMVLAHRFAHALFYADDIAGKAVRHQCNNPICVNPEHLVIGSNADNSADMVRDGRGRTGKQLKPAHVAHIRTNTTMSVGELAAYHGVSPSAIRKVLKNISYADATYERVIPRRVCREVRAAE